MGEGPRDSARSDYYGLDDAGNGRAGVVPAG